MARVVWSAVAVALVGIAVTAGAGPAEAHANLESSDPPDGALLDAAPTAVTLTFTEPPDPELSTIAVVDASGARVQTGPARPVSAPARSLEVSLPPDLADGVFTVTWRVVSERDGHFTSGAVAFGVGVSPGEVFTAPIPPSEVAGPTPLSVVGKIFLYAGLAILLAAAVVGIWALRGEVPARRIVLPVAWAFAASGALATLLAERSTVGVSIGTLLGSSTGRPYLWLLAATGILAVSVAWTILRPGRVPLVLVGVGAAAALLARVAGGHAAAAPTSAWLQVGIQFLHVLAVGSWIGGLVIVLLLLRSRRGEASPVAEVRRFSQMAGVAVAIVVATGGLRDVNELGGPSALLHIFSTSYGTTLAIKLALVATLIALGAVNRYRSIPRMSQDTGLLRSVMRAEVVAALAIFGVTATMTGFAPDPPEPRASRPQAVVATGADFATTVRVRLTVSPGIAGPNAFDARVTDFDSGEPIDATRVSLRFENRDRPDVASTLELDRGEAGNWSGTGTQLSIAGRWTVTVLVETADRGVEIPLELATREPPPRVAVSRQPGQPDIYTITFANGLALQSYNDPGTPGPNQLHLTAFDADGNELPLGSATLVAVAPSGDTAGLVTERFGRGHFVGFVDLTPGRWLFRLEAEARAGALLQASFEQTIEEGE